MAGVPTNVERLLEERQRAREAKDFVRADALRDQIHDLGFVIHDAPGGATLEERPKFETLDPSRIESVLDRPAVLDASIHLLYEGFPDDVTRFLVGLENNCAQHAYEVVLVDDHSDDGTFLESLASDRVRVVHLDRELGYAPARNAGLKLSRGRVVILADLSVEPTGDVLAPILEAFDDSTTGVAGPWGIVSDDMREFREAPGPEVDAIEGYFLATRRELLAKGLIHDKFRWYRHADIDLSFQLRALGSSAVVVPIPATKYTHRGWTSVDEAERAKRSKKNWNVFFDRWKNRPDLLISQKE
ncbi:MAG: glycosyltransferase [Actinomycetota bacterium]